ncbi:MAG: hypothetical protein ACLTEG_05835 [Acutalibacter sp.]
MRLPRQLVHRPAGGGPARRGGDAPALPSHGVFLRVGGGAGGQPFPPQEHLATLVCCLLWLAALLTRSLLRLPGVEYVYPFLRFAGDQHGVWLWNKAALTGTGLLLWVGWWLCGKRK